MSRVMGRMRLVLLVSAMAAALGGSTAASQQQNPEAVYQEARRLFDALDYERAVLALDQAIAAFEAAPADAARNERLASAYEMRARSRFGLGDQDGARADFAALLKLAPGHALSGQVSPRVVALFEETALTTVTNLTIALTPATAKLMVDGLPIAGPGTIRIAVGEHTITAEQPGYGAATQTVTAIAGSTGEVTLALERLSSVIRITTSPDDVDVKVDGKPVGRTATADETGGSAAPAATLLVTDIENGTHTVELTRECHVPVTQKIEVTRPDDYTVGPVTLRPAVGTLRISASSSGAQVFVDGRDRGVAPLEISDLCEGEHLVETRNKYGSDSRRVTVRAGDDLAIEAVLKPAFAIVSSSGGPATQQDVRVIVERAFAASKTVGFVAPPAADAQKALQAIQLTNDWLAIDNAGRPVGAAAQIAGPLRKDASAKLADEFRTQGVASVTMLDGSRAILALLTAGSAVPDVIEVALDSQSSIAAAIARLDRSLNLSMTSLGLQVIDVADVGVVVVAVDAPNSAPTIRAGDLVVQADGKPVADAAALAALVDGGRSGDTIAIELRDPSGAAKPAQLKVTAVPRVIGLSEQGLLANRLLLDLRVKLAETQDPFDAATIRLNMAVALARLGDWSGARDELQRVKLPEAPGVGGGTVQYLFGLAAENLGNRAEAETAFKAAAASDSLLTEAGPPVRELAEAKLLELQKGSK